MVPRIALLFTLCLIGLMALPSVATPHSPSMPRKFISDNITQASSSILVLNTNGASISSEVIDSRTGYAYFGTSATPAQIFKIRLSDFTNVANLTLGAGANAALAATAAILDPIHETAYFGTLNGQIVKVDLSTFTNVTAVHPGLGGINSATIDPTAGFGYFGTNTGNILKTRLSDLTVNATLTYTPSNTTLTLPPSHTIDSAVIDTTNGYAYFGASGCMLGIYCTPSPNIVIKVRLSDFSIVSELDVGVDDLTNAGIDTIGGYVYFGGANLAGSRIVRYSLSDLSKKQVLAPVPLGIASGFALDPQRGIGYALAGESLDPFRLSDFNQIAEEFLTNRAFNIRLGAVDPATGYSYFAASELQPFPLGQQAGVLRISPSTLPVDDFSLEPSPARVIFQEGGVGTAYITVKSDGYTGTIDFSTLSSSGYALGPGARLVQTTVALEANGDNYTILALSAPNQDDIPASNFAITITGSSGVISRSISIEVTIIPGTSHFLPIINSPSIAMNRYANTNYTSLAGPNYSDIALVTHTGFSGTVNFTGKITPSLPNGPTVKVDPSSVTENLPKETYTGVSWVYITANSTTTTGQYEVDVTATSGNETHTTQLCVLILPHSAIQFCLLSDPDLLILGPGQTRTTLVTQYMPRPIFNASMYLRTIDMTTSVVSGPSVTALQAILDPSTFPLPDIIPGPQQLETTLSLTASANAPPGNYILRISSTNGTITGFVDVPVDITAAPASSIPGVFPGDWARYKISSTWSPTPPGLPAIPEIATYLGSYEATLRIGATLGNETAGLLSTAYLNGTANVQEITGDTNEESGSLFPWITGSNLIFNQTTNEEFAGSSRQVTIFNITRTNGIVTVAAAWTWDLQTGILLDYQLNVQGTGNLGTINGRVHVGIIETNLWTPTLPFFTLTPKDSFLTGEQGTTTSTNIALTSINGFAGNISLQAQPLPSDPSLTFYINSVTLDPDGTVNAVLTARSYITGHFTILINATSSGQIHYALLELTVTAVQPVVTITSTSPNPANTGDIVTVDFNIHSGTEISDIAVDWGDGTVSHPAIAANSATHVYLTTEQDLFHAFTVNITATSIVGEGFATTTVSVNDQPPTTTITLLTQASTSTGATITLRFSATDPDGTVRSINIKWGDGATTILSGTAIQTTHDYTSQGTFIISVSATDDAGSASQPSTRRVLVNPSTTQTVTQPTILGLVPFLFYGLIGAVIIAVVAISTLATGRTRKLQIQLPPFSVVR